MAEYESEAEQQANGCQPKKDLNNKDIFSSDSGSEYFYSKGWHIKAIYSLIIGFIFSSSTIWNVNLMSFQTYSWLVGFFITSLTYYLLTSK